MPTQQKKWTRSTMQGLHTRRNLWRDELSKRQRKAYPVENEIRIKIVAYQKSHKKSQKMGFRKEDWYLELKTKEQELRSQASEAAKFVRIYGDKIDSLHRQERVPTGHVRLNKTRNPRRPRASRRPSTAKYKRRF